MELGEYFKLLVHYWKSIAIAAVLGSLAGLTFSLVFPTAPPKYTSQIEGVLLSQKGAAQLQEEVQKELSATAITNVLVRGHSLNKELSYQNFSDLRVQFYNEILLSEAILSPLAAENGLTVNALRKQITIETPVDPELIQISVSSLDGASAKIISESLAQELSQRIKQTEGLDTEVENLGTMIKPPNLKSSASSEEFRANRLKQFQEMLAIDPESIASNSGQIVDLLSRAEVTDISEKLNGIRTTDQIENSLTIIAAEPASAVSGNQATISITATDSDPAVASLLADQAASSLGNLASQSYGIDIDNGSPLVVTNVNEPTLNSVNNRDPVAVNIIVGLLIGLGTGVAIAIFRASQDSTIRSIHQLISISGEPPIGNITLGPESEYVSMSYARINSRSPETYRNLRSKLMFGLPDMKIFTLIPASASIETETVGMGLASAIAQTGDSVLLIHTQPTPKDSGVDLGTQLEFGLESVLLGECQAVDAITIETSSGVATLMAREPSRASSEILSSVSFTELVNDLRDMFSYIIVPIASTMDSADAQAVAGRCDGAMILVKLDETTSVQLQKVFASMTQVKVPIVGTVIYDGSPRFPD